MPIKLSGLTTGATTIHSPDDGPETNLYTPEVSGTIYLKPVVITSDVDITLEAYNMYFIDVSAASVDCTLPLTPAVNDIIYLKDWKSAANTYNISLLPNGNNLHGSTSTHTIDEDGKYCQLVYVDASYGWVIL